MSSNIDYYHVVKIYIVTFIKLLTNFYKTKEIKFVTLLKFIKKLNLKLSFIIIQIIYLSNLIQI